MNPHAGLVGPGAPLMSEIVADPPDPSCYLLFSGPGPVISCFLDPEFRNFNRLTLIPLGLAHAMRAGVSPREAPSHGGCVPSCARFGASHEWRGALRSARPTNFSQPLLGWRFLIMRLRRSRFFF